MRALAKKHWAVDVVGASLEVVSEGSPVTSRPVAIGLNSRVQVSVLVGEFSDKVSGDIVVSLQVSNDRQNWTSSLSVTAGFDKSGTVQVGAVTVSARYCRTVTTASPAGNTASFATDLSFAQP